MSSLKSKTLFLNTLRKAPLLLFLVLFFSLITVSSSNQTIKTCSSSSSQSCTVNSLKLTGTTCGGGTNETPVNTSIDLGCTGQGNPISDLIFALIRLLSDGVGLVVVLSVIIGGIQYILSRGDPGATQAAVKRLTSAVSALFLFIFAYALLNYLVPGGFLH